MITAMSTLYIIRFISTWESASHSTLSQFRHIYDERWNGRNPLISYGPVQILIMTMNTITVVVIVIISFIFAVVGVTKK